LQERSRQGMVGEFGGTAVRAIADASGMIGASLVC
jgi:hypothetical protein